MRAFLTLAMCGVMAVATTADDKKAVVREVDLKGYETNFRDRGMVTAPTKITSAEELAKALPGKDVSEKIGKQVDFTKEYLLLFKWSGSGQDKLTAGGDKNAVFTLKRGLTRDLRPHLHLFAVAKDTEWELAK